MPYTELGWLLPMPQEKWQARHMSIMKRGDDSSDPPWSSAQHGLIGRILSQCGQCVNPERQSLSKRPCIQLGYSPVFQGRCRFNLPGNASQLAPSRMTHDSECKARSAVVSDVTRNDTLLRQSGISSGFGRGQVEWKNACPTSSGDTIRNSGGAASSGDTSATPAGLVFVRSGSSGVRPRQDRRSSQSSG